MPKLCGNLGQRRCRGGCEVFPDFRSTTDHRASSGATTVINNKPKYSMNTPEQGITRIKNHIAGLQELHRSLKPQLDKVTKELAALGAKPDDPIEQVKLPIDAQDIEKVMAVLDDKPRSVKNFQVGLGIFDLTDLGRKRKALIAAGVTKENSNGNSIEVSLTDEFQQAVLDTKRKAEPEEAAK